MTGKWPGIDTKGQGPGDTRPVSVGFAWSFVAWVPTEGSLVGTGVPVEKPLVVSEVPVEGPLVESGNPAEGPLVGSVVSQCSHTLPSEQRLF